MFNKILLFALFYALSFTFSQIRYSRIFEKNYNELPIKVRIDNSGIYAISSFDVMGDTICLNSFDDHTSYTFHQNTFNKIIHESKLLKDFILDFKNDQDKFLQDIFFFHLFIFLLFSTYFNHCVNAKRVKISSSCSMAIVVCA